MTSFWSDIFLPFGKSNDLNGRSLRHPIDNAGLTTSFSSEDAFPSNILSAKTEAFY